MIVVGAGQMVAILTGLMLLSFLSGVLLAPGFYGRRRRKR
jgi:uncharacterized membrane protein affecting hemolysin expression